MFLQNDNQLLDYRLSAMEDQLNGLKADMQDLNAKTTQLVEALMGNPIVQSEGISGDLKKIKKKVYEHEEIVKKVKWSWMWILSIGGGLAVVIEVLIRLLKLA